MVYLKAGNKVCEVSERTAKTYLLPWKRTTKEEYKRILLSNALEVVKRMTDEEKDNFVLAIMEVKDGTNS